MAKPGYLPVALTALLTAAAWFFLPPDWNLWVGLGLLLALALLVNFFRDPDRALPDRKGVYAVAPADGRVVLVHESATGLQISIFLSVFDVHVNRMPIGGRITRLQNTPGKFLAAYKPEASTDNERETIEIESPSAGKVVCTQVAGLLARRIDNWVAEGDCLDQGARYGMIRFGSRVDMTLPATFKALVREGARVKAGSTAIAEIPRG
jgi:phosphatidylserine decarboxylase